MHLLYNRSACALIWVHGWPSCSEHWQSLMHSLCIRSAFISFAPLQLPYALTTYVTVQGIRSAFISSAHWQLPYALTMYVTVQGLSWSDCVCKLFWTLAVICIRSEFISSAPLQLPYALTTYVTVQGIRSAFISSAHWQLPYALTMYVTVQGLSWPDCVCKLFWALAVTVCIHYVTEQRLPWWVRVDGQAVLHIGSYRMHLLCNRTMSTLISPRVYASRSVPWLLPYAIAV